MNANRARGVFLAGTDTDVGKTRVAVGLIRALIAQGWRACGMKPVASGTISTEYGVINEDVDSIATASGRNSATAADINPYCFEWPISPHIGAERVGIVVDMGRIVSAYERLARDQDIVVVEGAGAGSLPSALSRRWRMWPRRCSCRWCSWWACASAASTTRC